MKKQLLILSLATLAIATPHTAHAQHCTTQKHESIWKIAKEYHLDFQHLLELNKHLKNPNLIYEGDKIETHPDSGTGSHHAPTTSNQTPPQDIKTDTEQANAVLELVNIERNKNNLPPLTLDPVLNQVATIKAEDMADTHYFSHDSPTLGTPFDLMHRYGVDYMSAGENIAAGQPTAKAVMDSWMNSSGHRANILNKNYTHLGVGYATGGEYGIYWVQEFTQQK